MSSTFTGETAKTISPEALELVRSLAKEFRDCMWRRHPDATVETWEDAFLIVQHMREYGGQRRRWNVSPMNNPICQSESHLSMPRVSLAGWIIQVRLSGIIRVCGVASRACIWIDRDGTCLADRGRSNLGFSA